MGSPRSGNRAFILRLGQLETPYEEMIPGRRDGSPYRFPVLAYLVVTGVGDRVLIDTGMHDGHAYDPAQTWAGTPYEQSIVPLLAPHEGISARLLELGITPDQITYVINTHLHFDHAGNNNLFLNAQMVVQTSQLRAAQERPASFPHRYWDRVHRILEVDGDVDLLPGIELLSTPGHVPGHQSVVVHLDDSPDLIFTGDAILSEEFLQHDDWSGFADPGQGHRSADRLLQFASAAGARLVYPHDPVQEATLRRAPDGYR